MSRLGKYKCAAVLFFLSAITSNLAHAAPHPCAVGNSKIGSLAAGANSFEFNFVDSKDKWVLAGLFSRRVISLKQKTAVEGFRLSKAADRYGRYAGHLFADETREWINGKLLREGKALFSPGAETRACRHIMLQEEKKAQKARVGIWAENIEQPVQVSAERADNLKLRMGEFLIVDGKVASVGNRKRRLYLNFGSNWSDDFTISVVKTGKGAFKGDIEELSGLTGKRIRIRGILEERQGPLIRLFDEGQLEIIDD